MSDSPAVVCVVDDDASVVKGVGRLLRAWRYQVRTCDARQLLDLAGREPLDCVVLDVHMPGLSGLDLQTELVRAGADLPVVFVTGHGDETTRDRALAGGAVAFLQKPFTDRQLIQAVEHAITRRRKGRAAAL